MGKVFVIVKDWEKTPDSEGKIKVFYSTWDGVCICTKQNHNDKILAPKDIDKRSIHLAILSQIFGK